MKVLRQSNLGRKLRLGLIITIHLSMVMIIIMLMVFSNAQLKRQFIFALVMNLINQTLPPSCGLIVMLYLNKLAPLIFNLADCN
jgi:hypothetical protein